MDIPDELTITVELSLKPPLWLDIFCECAIQGGEIRVKSIRDICEYHCDRMESDCDIEGDGWLLSALNNWPQVRERWLNEVRTAGYQDELWRQYRNLYGMTADQAAATNAEKDWELQTGR